VVALAEVLRALPVDAAGPAALARFPDPSAIAVDGSGTLYVLDKSNRVRMITPSGEVTTLAGSGEHGFADGPAQAAQLDYPTGIAAAADGSVFTADPANRRTRKIPAP
jgi:hypothetical protein